MRDAERRRRFDMLARIGCAVCKREMGVYSPAAIHHVDGKTKPGAHMRVLEVRTTEVI